MRIILKTKGFYKGEKDDRQVIYLSRRRRKIKSH